MFVNIMLEHNNINAGIPDVHYRASALSVEENEVLSKVADYFSDKLKVAGDVLKVNMNRVIDNITPSNMSSSELRKTKSAIEDIQSKVKYNNVSAVEIPVTLGMKKDLYSSLSDILYVFDTMVKDVPEAIDKLDEVSSKMLSNNDFKKSGRPFKDTGVTKMADELQDTLNKLIDPNGVNDRMPVSKLLPNLSSLTEIVEMLDKLSILTDKKHLKKIMAQSKGISNNIDYLYEEYQKNNTEVKKERLVELGYYLENTAKAVTAYVSVIHLISQFSDTLNHILKTLDK